MWKSCWRSLWQKGFGLCSSLKNCQSTRNFTRFIGYVCLYSRTEDFQKSLMHHMNTRPNFMYINILNLSNFILIVCIDLSFSMLHLGVIKSVQICLRISCDHFFMYSMYFVRNTKTELFFRNRYSMSFYKYIPLKLSEFLTFKRSSKECHKKNLKCFALREK